MTVMSSAAETYPRSDHVKHNPDSEAVVGQSTAAASAISELTKTAFDRLNSHGLSAWHFKAVLIAGSGTVRSCSVRCFACSWCCVDLSQTLFVWCHYFHLHDIFSETQLPFQLFFASQVFCVMGIT